MPAPTTAQALRIRRDGLRRPSNLEGAWRRTGATAASSSIDAGIRQRATARRRIGDAGGAAGGVRRADAALFTGGAPARPPLLFFDLETTGLSGGAGTLRVSRGLRLVRRRRRVRDAAVPADAFADERTLLEAVAARAGARRRAGELQRQVVRRAAARNALLFHRLEWSGGRCRTSTCCIPRGDSGTRRRAVRRRREFLLARWRSSGRSSAPRRPRRCAGFEIPARYFQFVRSGDARPLARCSSTTASTCCRWRR